MYNFIFILGAQGVGKTTLARLLKEKLTSVHIDFDWIRDFHLNKDWSNTSESEEEMSLVNLVFLLKNYAKHEYKNVIVSGFTENNIANVLEELKEYKSIVITSYVTDDDVLKNRVLTGSRDSGFRDYKASIEFNKKLRDELRFLNEYKIDSTHQKPEETLDHIISILAK